MDAFLKDLKHSARMFVQAPSFTIAAVVSLALGIAANTAMFSVVNTVLLKPFAFTDPDRIVMVQNLVLPAGVAGTASPTEFNWWRQQTQAFQHVSAYSLFQAANLTGDAVAQRIQTMRVSADFFRLAGATPLHGRLLSGEDDVVNGPKTAVLAYTFWQQQYGGDPQVIGRRMTLDGVPYAIVGVAGPGLADGQLSEMMRGNGDVTIETPPDVYVASRIDPNSADHAHEFNVAARLKPGVTLADANAYIQASFQGYARLWPDDVRGRAGFRVQPLQDAIVGGVRGSLLILLGAVSLVLLIACANVANLLLARATGRTREIAIRAAVGAGRGRLIRQLLTESVLLSLVAGVVGAAMGYAGIRALLSLSPGDIPRIGLAGASVTLDWRVLAFTLVVSVLTGVLFGLVPAVRLSRADVTHPLKEGGNRGGTGARHNRTRALIVATETALALVLLIAAGLLIRSFVAIRDVHPGFDARNVLTMRLLLTGPRFEDPAAVARVVHDSIRRIRELPGVEVAATASDLPMEPPGRLGFQIAGRPYDPVSSGGVAISARVSAGYFETFRIPVVRGRTFTERDETGPPAVIVNETLARQYWPNGDPLRDRLIIAFREEPPRQIIGVVGDIHYRLNREPLPAMYVLSDVGMLQMAPTAWVIRTRGTPLASSAAIEHELRVASGGLPVAEVRTMEEIVSRSTAAEDFNALVLTIFGCAALVLAAVGIYGLMAYSVTQRTQEIGVRLALGADSSQIRNMVGVQGLRPALAGVLCGLVAAFGLTRLIAGLLFGVQAWDPLVFCAVPVILLGVALVAVGMPAMRASRIDPVRALRYE